MAILQAGWSFKTEVTGFQQGFINSKFADLSVT